MRNFALLLTASFVFTGAFTGCAHKAVENTVDEKLQKAPPVASIQEIRYDSRQLIMTSPDLSADRKKALLDLQTQTASQMDGLREESLKLRALLVQEIAQANFKPKEIDSVKKRIKNVEDKRVALLFKSVDQALEIMGRDKGPDVKVLRAFTEYPDEGILAH